MRVKIEATGLWTYPDVSLVCGSERFLDEERDTLLNPTLVGEVLSDLTEAYDRGTKFSRYRLIPSLRHVLFVSQKEPRIECYARIGSSNPRHGSSTPTVIANNCATHELLETGYRDGFTLALGQLLLGQVGPVKRRVGIEPEVKRSFFSIRQSNGCKVMLVL